MSKLLSKDKFLDLSDYGRPLARLIASLLKNTPFTPIHVTICFGICGLLSILCVYQGHYIVAGLLLILKSILDAADGELSRLKNTPSYVGRYLDSIFDIILNLFLVLTFGVISDSALWISLLAFFCIQLQGTLYNYYYVILRTVSAGGDSTSKIFETTPPQAMPGESQQTVNIMFRIFFLLYGLFDKMIISLDLKAYRSSNIPKWFMTIVSLYGLGTQLLMMAIFFAFDAISSINPFFIVYTTLLPFMILLRKSLD